MYQPKKLPQPSSTHVVLEDNVEGGALRFMTFNAEGMRGNLPYIIEILKKADIVFFQEHWLFGYQLNEITDLLPGWKHAAVATDVLQPVSNHNLCLTTTLLEGGAGQQYAGEIVLITLPEYTTAQSTLELHISYSR